MKLTTKQIVLIVSAVLVLAAVIVLVAVLGAGRNNEPAAEPLSDPDALYPYTVSEKSGSVEITVSGDFGEYGWKAAAENPDPAVAVSEGKTDKNAVRFTVTPLQFGADRVVLTLEKEDVLPDARFAIFVSFVCDGEGGITAIGAFSRELAGCRTFADDAHPYALAEAADGSYLLSVGKPGTDEWSALLTENRYIAAEKLGSDENALLYRIVPTAAGSNTLYLCNVTAGTALEIPVTVSEGLRLTIGPSGFAPYDADTVRAEQYARDRQSEIESMVGKLRIPAPLTFVSWNTSGLLGEGGMLIPLVRVNVMSEGAELTWCVSREVTRDVLAANYALSDKTPEAVALGETGAERYVTGDTVLLLWTDGAGDLFWITAAADNAEAALKAAGILAAANPGLSAQN